MKTTYLLNKEQPDGSICLSVASAEEWRATVAASKESGQRRYFIFDYIFDQDDVDRMVIEVSADDYRQWSRERMAAKRNRELGKSYQHLSLDALIIAEDSQLCLGDIIVADKPVENVVLDQMVIDTLRIELAEWRPWANDLLDYYLSGMERSCSEAISEKYGVSTRTVRKYKQQLESFIKKYLWGVPF